ncbi:MAG: ATP phosphoribosyltransferase [Candidatus Izemoplasmataceae bacterium]
MNEPLTIALPTGRLGQQTITFLQKAKIISSLDTNSRKLKIVDQEQNITYLFIKPTDIATYVEKGVADLGIVGKDTLLEQNKQVYELLPLGIGQCIIAIAGFKNTILKPSKETLIVASKYPNITKTYFKSINQPIQTIYLNGSVELAPLMGLSDVIVDIVETGSTLKANNLAVLETVMSVEATLIASKTNYQFKYERIIQLLSKMKEALL